jgi:hypothetical protein
MKISSLSNLITKFSHLVKNAVLAQNQEFMVLEEITVPGSKKGEYYFIHPGTPLFIDDFSDNGLPLWNISGQYSSKPLDVDEFKLLNLREFFTKVANLLPGGEFIPLAHGPMREFEISAYNGALNINIYFDPKMKISITDNRNLDEEQVSIDNFYKTETSKTDPSKKYSVMSLEALNAFSDPRKFLDFIGVSPRFNSRSLLDSPSTISDSEE